MTATGCCGYNKSLPDKAMELAPGVLAKGANLEPP